MTPLERNAPEFFIIGAQKSATSWLWNMLDKHPGTSLPSQKEIHYFGSSELYSKGDDWYYNHFKGLDPDKVIGEASTTYFYDRAPYWYNQSSQIVIDESLPTIPELITQKFPERKFIVILRDPVRRAISAYSHWLKKGKLSPFLGLTNVIKEHPRLRILEYGLYAKYLKVWMKHVPSDRFRVIVYEDQIRKNWDQTLSDTYEYLGLDPAFKPELPSRRIHKSWGWNRIVFNYYAGKIYRNIGNFRAAKFLDQFKVFENAVIKPKDIEYLRSVYLPEKDELDGLIGKKLSSWDYGEGLLRQSI